MKKSYQPEPELIKASALFLPSRYECNESLIWLPQGVSVTGGSVIYSKSRTKECGDHISSIFEQKYKSTEASANKNGIMLLKICAGKENIMFSLSTADLYSLARNKTDLILDVWKDAAYFQAPGVSEELLKIEQKACRPYEVYAGLRITGLDMTPSRVSQILDLQPTDFFSKGNFCKELNKPYGFSKWNLSTEFEDGTTISNASRRLGGDLFELNSHLKYLLRQLAAKRSALKQVRTLASHFSVFVYWGSDDFYLTQTKLDWEVAQSLANYDLKLVLDVYI